MNRRRRPAQRRARPRNSLRQTVVVFIIGITLGGAAFATDQYIEAKQASAAMAAAAASAKNDAEIYTGSILRMLDRGNVCRQWLFDNNGGGFTDNGYVDCDRAAYRGRPNGFNRGPDLRVSVISSGFRGD